MQDRETIREYLSQIEELQGRGEYPAGYERAKRLLVLCEGSRIDAETHCRVLIQSARSCYYVSRFSECVSLLDAAHDLMGRNEIVLAPVLRFESALVRANVFRREGKLREALIALEPLRDSDSERGRPSLLPEKLLIEGACRYYLNEIDRAEERLETALGLATHYADSKIKARVLIMLGLVAQTKGLHRAALEYFERAKDLCAANADRYGEAAAALNLGILLYRCGRLSAAETSIERAKAIFDRIEWRIGTCRCLLALGSISKCRAEFVRAVRSYREAERIAVSNGFARERALVYELIGDVHVERGRLSAADKCYRIGLSIAESIAPEGDIVVEIDRRIGDLLLAGGNGDSALPFLRDGLRLSRRLGDKLEQGAILRSLGRAAFARKARLRGRVLFRAAIRALRDGGCDFELARTHLVYAGLLIDAAGVDPMEAFSANEHEELIDEAWSNAIEAGHLFGGMDVPLLKGAAARRLDAVIARRRRTSHAAQPFGVGTRVVKISPAPESIVSKGFVAVSGAMLVLWEQSRFAAGFDRPVLVTGETGTGKELVARTIHSLSGRALKPFVALNCAAVPDHLFESEFFGHKKGCFTGALTDRIGFFEAADGGTLFLDEVGELTPLQQVKLLRVLQEGKIRRVGENVERPVDVRIISATNRNLDEKLGKAALRDDFYYRINAEHINVPALRERREDIVPLMGYCLCGGFRDAERRFVRIELSALRCLERYSWPGNVRELFAVLDRVKHVSNGEVITRAMLPERIRVSSDESETGARERSAIASLKASQLVRQALDQCGGNKSAAARRLGISRGTLYKQLRRSGLLGSDGSRRAALGTTSVASGTDSSSPV
jgi:DNA-binding NtrC family response regulator/tetratricopeptide (TPR) repeat protein